MSTTDNQQKIRAVLFDLDGTLVDTAKDFVRILHEQARENGFQAPSDQHIRQQVSAGSKAMVSLFSNADQNILDEAYIDRLRQQFLDRYEANVCVDSCLFSGLESLLTDLEIAGIPWGVVTNKPRYLAEKLLSALTIAERCSVLVCPDDVTQSKPHPEPMYLAMDTLGITQSEANSVVYIGDHMRDIEAGNSAGNITVTAGYGYVSADDEIQAWGADYVVTDPAEFIQLILELIE